jgi:hypothetical protein
MFRTPVDSQLDQPFYEPTKDYIIFDNDLFWIYIKYNNNLFNIESILKYILYNTYFNKKINFPILFPILLSILQNNQ